MPPDCYTAYAFSKQAFQATTMADLASLRANARRYRELKGKDITWPMPE